MQLVIPDCSLDSALQCFQGVTPTQDHYCLTEIPLYAFTEVEFIKTFIKKGNDTGSLFSTIANPLCMKWQPGYIGLFFFVSDEKNSHFSPVIKIRLFWFMISCRFDFYHFLRREEMVGCMSAIMSVTLIHNLIYASLWNAGNGNCHQIPNTSCCFASLLLWSWPINTSSSNTYWFKVFPLILY